MIAIAKAPFLFENRFLEKILFISRWCLSFRGRKKRFACENNRKWNEGENPFRLIEYIDRVETKKEIQYLVNATRCLLADFIDIATYFRICHAATYTLDEDLQFLKTHIEKK